MILARRQIASSSELNLGGWLVASQIEHTGDQPWFSWYRLRDWIWSRPVSLLIKSSLYAVFSFVSEVDTNRFPRNVCKSTDGPDWSLIPARNVPEGAAIP